MKIWYSAKDKTKVISFGKVLPSYPDEDFFEADGEGYNNEELRFYWIEWEGDVPTLHKMPGDEVQKILDNELLESAKFVKKQEVKEQYAIDLELPVDTPHGFFNGGFDSGTLADQAGRKALRKGLATVYFTNLANDPVAFTPDELVDLGVLIGDVAEVKFFKKQTLMKAIDNAESVEAVDAIKYEGE